MKLDWLGATHYLPFLTTVLSAVFCGVLVRAYRVRRTGPHLLWWAVGAFTYGAGTLIESAIAVYGNNVALTKAWYIAGALLGGFPLAQGVVYLHLKRKTADVLAAIFTTLIVALSICVVFSPVVHQAVEATRPSGKVLEWTWIRYSVPIINLYAFVALVGGAIMSAVRYARKKNERASAVGNVLIAIGGLLPGIGGGMAAAGMVEALYVLELLGLIFIWWGYALMVGARHRAPALAPEGPSRE